MPEGCGGHHAKEANRPRTATRPRVASEIQEGLAKIMKMVGEILVVDDDAHMRDLVVKAALRLLLDYDWPGNIRELEKVIERAVILGHGSQILPEDLPVYLHIRKAAVSSATGYHRPTLEELERDYIATVLQETQWHRMQTANILGIDRRTLYRKIRTCDLHPSH